VSAALAAWLVRRLILTSVRPSAGHTAAAAAAAAFKKSCSRCHGDVFGSEGRGEKGEGVVVWVAPHCAASLS